MKSSVIDRHITKCKHSVFPNKTCVSIVCSQVINTLLDGRYWELRLFHLNEEAFQIYLLNKIILVGLYTSLSELSSEL